MNKSTYATDILNQITSFIEVDEAVWKSLSTAKYLNKVAIVGDHHMVVCVTPTAEMMSFLDFHPEDCFIESNVNFKYQPSNNPDHTLFKLLIGLSFKNTSQKLLNVIAKSDYPLGIIDIRVMDCKIPTENEFLFKESVDDQYFFIKGMVVLTPAEECWLELWDGFDHHWEYSDDYSVAKRCQQRIAEINTAGLAMGISQERCDELYRITFCKR